MVSPWLGEASFKHSQQAVYARAYPQQPGNPERLTADLSPNHRINRGYNTTNVATFPLAFLRQSKLTLTYQ
jgi:hypothetical protein